MEPFVKDTYAKDAANILDRFALQNAASIAIKRAKKPQVTATRSGMLGV